MKTISESKKHNKEHERLYRWQGLSVKVTYEVNIKWQVEEPHDDRIKEFLKFGDFKKQTLESRKKGRKGNPVCLKLNEWEVSGWKC